MKRTTTINANICRMEAFEAFRDALPRLESTEGLLDAAIAISYHALDDLDYHTVDAEFDRLVERIESRVINPSFETTWTQLHEVLFEEEGFRGNVDNYYNPVNSYIPVVLGSRRGIPITLCLVYKVVAERLGLQVEGVNAPGHFLVRIVDEDKRVLVDPFVGGRILTTPEALRRVSSMVGTPCEETHLVEATHHEWVARILKNLQYIFAAGERTADLEAMNELAYLLESEG